MPAHIDLFDSTYGNFTEKVIAAIRQETFGQDIGQNSWLTADEYDRFRMAGPGPDQHVLEVASGSGGPALYLADRTGCHVTGIDANENGVADASWRPLRLEQSRTFQSPMPRHRCPSPTPPSMD